MIPTPVTKDLVLLGGGHAHVEVLRRFGMQPEPGLRITLITRELHTPYSGMLPGLIAGHYTADEAHIDLAPLAAFAGARLFHDEVCGIDLMTQRISCRTRPPVSYDLLSIDTGAEPNVAVSGAVTHGVPVKPVSQFYPRWLAVYERLRRSPTGLSIAVVGAGAGGVELILAMQEQICTTIDGAQVQFHLLTASEEILDSHPARLRQAGRRRLQDAGISVHTGFEVVSVEEPGVLISNNGQRLKTDEIFWVTHAAAPSWPRDAGLKTDSAGFIAVDAALQSVSHPGVFAAGDIAAVAPYPRPKAGVFAVRQGPPLADNLRRAARRAAPRAYRPQRRFLSILSLGARSAVASRGALFASGTWVWHWKDFIDRRFMRRYQELPAMQPAPAGDTAVVDDMRCGGCGAKIGAEVLREALTVLAPARRAHVLLGIEEGDDAAVVRVPADRLAVQTVDAFRSFIDDPWTLGRVAAHHALNDIYAMGAEPSTALALVTLPYAESRLMQEDLVQLLRGAVTVLEAADTTLVGGHTAEGAELAIGFAVNGHVAPERLVRKRGVYPGDRLILTQPLGSGVLFAAAMRGLAQARWIEAAIGHMCTSKADAARCFLEHGVHAMTDVTGFGLVGHLLQMLDGRGATLNLGELPLYTGAEVLAARKVRSTLHEENSRVRDRVSATHSAAFADRYELAFDPQTAGGLLAAIPDAQAGACLEALHRLGFREARDIGSVDSVKGSLHLVD